MTAREVWAVSEGYYSDYRVTCLFSTRELAEAHRAQIGNNPNGWHQDSRVESFVMFDELPKQVTVWTAAGRVVDGVEHPGRLKLGFFQDHPAPPEDALSSDTDWEHGYLYGATAPMMGARSYCPPIDKGVGMRVEVRGTDKDRVEKAYHDRIAQAKAEQAGVA